MALVFVAIDPNTGGDHCPAVFVEDETGDLLFQGWTVTDPQTLTNVNRYSAAGEQVRWLSRRRASDLCLPGNDFWIFDKRLIRFSHFAGNGDFLEDELCDDPAVVKMCAAAFEAVWDRAIPHAEYRPA